MQYLRSAVSLLLLLTFRLSSGISSDQFYSYGEDAGDKKLPNEDEGATDEVELESPFVFYGETHFSVFVNINGILSFLTEIPYFFNAQFPLGYPVIAPFYSDVDISGTGNVYYRETSDPTTVKRVSSDIEENFEEGAQFRPRSVFITTWDAVGAFQGRKDKVNTFQVIMVTDSRESYIILYYADGGLQWLQGDGKTSGLPDALGQAGFISGDGRLYTLRGSGTDQVRNLNKWSNVGQPGVWMFKVGRVLPGKNIEPANKITDSLEGVDSYSRYLLDDSSCSSGGSICHSSAVCNDYDSGFCCACNEDFYGNGINCLRKDTPVRVTGKLAGNMNGIEIEEADLHSYVLSAEGRTYTAVSRIPKESGYDLQSLTAIGEGIAWLFATPKKGVSNGFTLTGGLFNRTVEVKFPQTGHTAVVEQVFEGLDVFNNVAVQTKITGSLPTVPIGSELAVDAFSEEFTRVKSGQLRAHSSRNFRLKGQMLETPYSVETFINFDECEHEPQDPQLDTLRMKVAENIFIRFDEAEAIVRYSFSAKIGTLEEEDPCIKGREGCGPNSQCIVDGDNFRCVCEQGYDYVFDAIKNAPICLDINECDIGRDLCDKNAQCINNPGSYSCECNSGFTGDGSYCNPKLTCHNAGCDPNASCREVNDEPECECNVGYKGDGFFCSPDFGDDSCHIAQNCSPYAVCVPTASGYSCRCLQGYLGDGYTCEVDRLSPEDEYDNRGQFYPPVTPEPQPYQPLKPVYPEPAPTLKPYDPNAQPEESYDADVKPIEPLVLVPECIQDVCWCPQGYVYDRHEGYCKESMEDSQKAYDNSDNPQPVCHGASQCSCPVGFLYDSIYNRCDSISEAPPCNVVNNCHPNAQCLYDSSSETSHCTCNAGYTGGGLFCSPLEVSCDQVDVCHFNADCIYDDGQLMSVCVCKPGYTGDGLVCTPQDDCNSASDCDENAQCHFDPHSQRYVCKCNDKFEGNGFYCNPVQEETCVTLQNCDPNADCVYEPYIQNYECQCREEYEGDGYSCQKIEVTCNVVHNCGQNAECSYDSESGGFQCKCIEGFTGDGFLCKAVHSCLNDPTICHSHALCQRSSSDEYEHECVCIPGYTGDGYECEKAPDHEKNILIINQGLSVLRMPIDSTLGNGYPIHIDPYMTAVGADVDCLAGTYYWTDVGSQSIRASKYDGKDRRPVVTGGQIGSPEDVAVDWVSKNIYWTDSLNDVVGVADLEGNLVKTVIEGDLVNPRGITVHPGLGFLFWSDWNRDNPKIEKSGMDGSGREILVSGQEVSLPNSLAVDFETSTLCWADAGTHRIECIGIQGYGRRMIIEGVKYPFGLSLHTRNFFYTDWNDTRIHEVSKYTGMEESVRSPPPGGSGKLYGIAAVPEYCPPVSNVCQVNRGNCPETHLCLPNGKGGRTCACPDTSTEDQCSDYQY